MELGQAEGGVSKGVEECRGDVRVVPSRAK